MNHPDLLPLDKENSVMEFKESFYRDVEFKNVKFCQNKVYDVEFYNCTFLNCNLIKSILHKCEFEKCSFISCDLSLIIPNDSKFIDITFTKSKIVGVDWSYIKALSAPSKFNFYDCKIDNSSFHGLNLQGIKFHNCSAHDVDFEDTDLAKSDFKGTDLLKSRFKNTNLTAADLSGATDYSIDPNLNKLKKTILSYPEATSLLNFLDIIIK